MQNVTTEASQSAQSEAPTQEPDSEGEDQVLVVEGDAILIEDADHKSEQGNGQDDEHRPVRPRSPILQFEYSQFKAKLLTALDKLSTALDKQYK